MWCVRTLSNYKYFSTYSLYKFGSTNTLCTEHGINLEQIQATNNSSQRIKLEDDAVEAILINDDSKQRYLALVRNLTKLYKAILPDPAGVDFGAMQYLLSAIALHIKNLNPEVDISEVKEVFFLELVDFAQELNVEDKRAISLNLHEEELVIFDLGAAIAATVSYF